MVLDKCYQLLIRKKMDSLCSSTWTLSSAAEYTDSFGVGIEWGLGKMLVGVAQGVLTEMKADNIEHCITEVQGQVCNMVSAYNEAFTNHDMKQAMVYVTGIYADLDTTMADCKNDVNTDLPGLKDWASVLQSPNLVAIMTKNVMRHVFAFTEYFNAAKRTWDAQSYFWTGERMGTMLVMATTQKNILYQMEVDAGIEVDFEGEDYILQ